MTQPVSLVKHFEGRVSFLPRGEFSGFHIALLQEIIDVGFIEVDLYPKMFRKVCKKLNYTETETVARLDPVYIHDVIVEINEKLKASGMVIGQTRCNIKGNYLHFFSFSIRKPIIMMQHVLFTQNEVTLLKRIMHHALRKFDLFTFSVEFCVRIAHAIEGSPFTTDSISEFFNKVIPFRYFHILDSTVPRALWKLTLGVRTMTEFETILWKNYPDAITYCSNCDELMLHGFKCPQPECKFCFHIFCKSSFNDGSCEICDATMTLYNIENPDPNIPLDAPTNFDELDDFFELQRNIVPGTIHIPSVSASPTPTQRPQPRLPSCITS